MKRVFDYIKNDQMDNSESALDIVRVWMLSSYRGRYRIEMKRVNPSRTVSQNKLMWVWFSAIAEAWSEATDRAFTRNDVHDAYCQMFLPVETPKGRVGGSTSGLSTEEMSAFMDRVHADASSDGIVLLNPEDRMYEQWASQYE
jgi:hypothetical protein